MRRTARWGVLFLCLCAGCQTPVPSPVAPPAPPVTAPPVPVVVVTAADLAALENRIFALVASERATVQARPLAQDPELADIARTRSRKMAETASFGESGGDDHASASLLMRRDAEFEGLLGENVAALSIPSDTRLDVDRAAARLVQIWLASPEHRENLMFAGYTRCGVGAADGGHTLYVTTLFAAGLDTLKAGQ
jgi:uncharacterized protein YkwD